MRFTSLDSSVGSRFKPKFHMVKVWERRLGNQGLGPSQELSKGQEKNWKSNNENAIVLPENLNQNRSTKALFGFTMIVLGLLALEIILVDP